MKYVKVFLKTSLKEKKCIKITFFVDLYKKIDRTKKPVISFSYGHSCKKHLDICENYFKS